MPFDGPQNNTNDQSQISWKDDWTLVVDLGVVFDIKGPHGKLGSEEALHEMEGKLAVLPAPAKTSAGDAVRLFVGALAPHAGASQSPYDFNVYKLQDGHLKLMSSAPTAGLEGDLRKLTGLAAPRMKGEKMGLVLNAHGTPSPGYLIGGASDQASSSMRPEAFAAIVNEWLNKDPLGFDKSMNAGRKLEFLDKEICFGGKLGSLNLDSRSAKNLVASELVVHEGNFPGQAPAPDQTLNGQNIAKIYEDLVRQPKLSGAELADMVITDANQGANDLTVDGRKYSAMPILAHYDLGIARDDFMKSLDGLGAALSGALANPTARRRIGGLIDGMPDIWSDEDTANQLADAKYSGRDLNTFICGLKSAIADKTLLDLDGTIARAIDTASGAEQTLVKSLHAARSGGEWDRKTFIDPEKLGGISVSLPPAGVRSDKSLTQDQYDQSIGSDLTGEEAPNWRKFLNLLRD